MVGETLVAAMSSLSAERRKAFAQHLHGGTSADYLSDWLARAGHQVSASTIRAYRRKEG